MGMLLLAQFCRSYYRCSIFEGCLANNASTSLLHIYLVSQSEESETQATEFAPRSRKPHCNENILA